MRNTPQPQQERLNGIIERITYHSEETGFAVLKVKVRGFKELVTVTGTLPHVTIGEDIEALGFWTNNPEYGRQFKAEFLRSIPPTTLEGIEKYLGSGLIKGIGPVYASKLVKCFGKKVLDIIETQPQRLCEVEGIGPKRIELIARNWQEQKSIREIMLFLQSHGVSTSKATRIFKIYGNQSIAVLVNTPYQLIKDIRGIGFISADKIALKMGIAEDSVKRARAGLSHVLSEALNEGHCGLPEEELIKRSAELLKINQDILYMALNLECREETLVSDVLDGKAFFFLKAFHVYEQYISWRLKKLNSEKPIWPNLLIEQEINHVSTKLNIEFALNQKEAIAASLQNKVTIITGGPGTGKTTIMSAVIAILEQKGIRIKLCAPTGKAAKRLSETTKTEATTIHRLLGMDPSTGKFLFNQDRTLDCDLLILDESSMIDVNITYHLLRALPEKAALLLVGDIDQLPSVGPGQILADIINSQAIPVIKLTQIFRQASHSQIITNAHLINQGKMPVLDHKTHGQEVNDFYFVEAEENETVVSKIKLLIKERIPSRFGFNPIKDIQVLTPMQIGTCGARNLNIELQQALNPNLTLGISKYGNNFALNDKVMQIENNYNKEVFNGDSGWVKYIDREEQKLIATFDGKDVKYGFDELDELSLAYATTIHKSQGSEYPAVIIPVVMQHYVMLQRNLIYTGITRGKKLVILVGQKKAIAIAVRNQESKKRYTKLEEWLKN